MARAPHQRHAAGGLDLLRHEAAALDVIDDLRARVAAAPRPPAAPTAPAALPAAEASFARALAEERGLPLAAVQSALANARYNATVSRLMAPAATTGVRQRSWPGYRARFVEPIRIRGGLRFWQENAATLARAEQTYGVPAAVIVAIIGVETVYGRNMGNFRILDALYTLAFSFPATPERDRSDYFRGELAEYLAATISQGVAPESLRGSYAGAMGMPQFMPTSLRNYAVTANGRGGLPDLIGNTDDAIFSVANYLAGHGWQRGQPVFAPVRLPGNAATLVEGGLAPTLSWQQLTNAGAQLSRPPTAGVVSGGLGDDGTLRWSEHKLGVVNLPNDPAGTVEHRVGTPNFFVITQYNRSYFYAASVADLATELEKAYRP
ncbi:lytic murein transglycosylase B [Achromobacter sp. GG226]|nr:lytic murein transglycosylase B [Verticiella sp. GG226]